MADNDQSYDGKGNPSTAGNDRAGSDRNPSDTLPSESELSQQSGGAQSLEHREEGQADYGSAGGQSGGYQQSQQPGIGSGSSGDLEDEGFAPEEDDLEDDMDEDMDDKTEASPGGVGGGSSYR